MKSFFAVPIATSLVALSHAGPSERAIVAAMKLSEQPNYSWTTTVIDDARTYDIDGKTDRGGYTWMRLPMVKAIAQRLGREADADIEAVFKDSRTFVLRTDRGWKMLRELPKRAWDARDDVEYWPAPLPVRGNLSAAAMAGLDPLDLSGFPAPVAILPPPPEEERRPYSNAQFALSHPHEELGIIVSSHATFDVKGDEVTGMLSDLGAQLLLVREGQDHLQPLAAAGVFKLQIKNGMVMRYHLRLQGVLLVDRKKVHVHQESHTQVRDVGSTSVQLTEDLQRKLAL